jgi:hypothetical protein
METLGEGAGRRLGESGHWGVLLKAILGSQALPIFLFASWLPRGDQDSSTTYSHCGVLWHHRPKGKDPSDRGPKLLKITFSSFCFWQLNSGPHLLSRCSTTRATPLALFSSVIFQVGFQGFCTGYLGQRSLPFLIAASQVTEVTHMSHSAQLNLSFL